MGNLVTLSITSRIGIWSGLFIGCIMVVPRHPSHGTERILLRQVLYNIY